MWKDFFYYSKADRRAVYVLLVLIAVLMVGIVVMPDVHRDKEAVVPAADSLAIKILSDKEKDVGKRKQPREMDKIQAVLKEFDPNLADSIELLQLGLSPYVARNVIKYREKGGRFPTPESFSRIYGLTEKQFETLRPYIRISEVFARKKKNRRNSFAPDKKEVRKDTIFVKAFKYPEGTLVDVNTADTTELKKIPGIGSGIARAIVGYRERLGGFYALEQLQEIKFVTPELLEWFKLGDGVIRKLNINKDGLDKLRAHPYVNFYQAKVIVEHRRKRGQIKSLSQLSLYEEFTEKDLVRLANYFSFD